MACVRVRVRAYPPFSTIQKFMHGMLNYHTWKRVLPRQEIAMRGSHSHCHMWLILKAMPRAVTHDEEIHYTHCFEAYLHCIIN